MYKDFIVKQTADFDSQFRPRTLVGNWYEERCDPQKSDNFHFYKERMQDGTQQPTLTQVLPRRRRTASSSPPATGSTSSSTARTRPSRHSISKLPST